MACTFDLISLVGGTPNNGGTFFLRAAYETPVPAPPALPVDLPGPHTFIVSGNETTVQINGAFSAPNVNSYEVTIDVSSTATGRYLIDYVVSDAGFGCSSTSTITLTVINGAVAGTDVEYTVCSSTDYDYSLFEMLRSDHTFDTNGELIEGVEPLSTTGSFFLGTQDLSAGTLPSGFVRGSNYPVTATFNPNGVALGTYNFIYKVNQGGAAGCENCVDEAVVKFVVVTAPNAGQNANVTLCNSTPV
jgi:hypothetical protein